MILLDTNIVIDFWHGRNTRISDIVKTHDVCVCGIVLAELMNGAKNEQELAEVHRLLSAMPQVGVPESAWTEMGRNLYALRKVGLKFPFQDVLLATLAIVHDLEIWTNDSHFALMQQTLKSLRLFEPSKE